MLGIFVSPATLAMKHPPEEWKHLRNAVIPCGTETHNKFGWG
jgi:hypothetical protein